MSVLYPTGSEQWIVVSDLACCGSDYYALRDICPHRTGPLCRGPVRPLVLSDGMTYTREGEIVKCP